MLDRYQYLNSHLLQGTDKQHLTRRSQRKGMELVGLMIRLDWNSEKGPEWSKNHNLEQGLLSSSHKHMIFGSNPLCKSLG